MRLRQDEYYKRKVGGWEMNDSNSLLFQMAALGVHGIERWGSRCYQNVSFS